MNWRAAASSTDVKPAVPPAPPTGMGRNNQPVLPKPILPNPVPPAEPPIPVEQTTTPNKLTQVKPVKKKRSRRSVKPWAWSVFCLSALGLVGGLGITAFLWLTNLPPLPDCRRISPLSADMERLYCAREAAQSGEANQLIAGVKLVQGWSSTHPLYPEAQELLNQWSAQLLAIAQTTAEESGLDRAVEIANQIPENSTSYANAQAAIAQWQADWKQGEAIFAKAQEALKQQRWNEAAAQVPALGRLENNYWRRDKASELTQQVLTEKAARERLKQALVLATTDEPDQLGQAIALVQTVNPKTYAWPEAEAVLKEWSQLLLTAGMQRWQQGDLTAAIALVHHVPLNLEMEPEARNLVRFSRAHKLATQHLNPYEPSVKEILSLMEAVAALRQIEPTSALYPQAQAKIDDWQSQVNDLAQLQYAHWTASLGQRITYEVAIGQAQRITSDRPQRIRAQTLVAHWGQQIQRIEDQPYLLVARAQAERGTVSALQQAIAAAQQVPLGRALRQEADLAIAQWSRQIQVIEDKPLLDKAQTLAQQGKLSEAIAAATEIQEGRALYEQAQTAIATWKAEIREAQIAQDRRILDEAASLAASTRLTLAIEKAAQIGAGRPLYGEAQAAIAQWEAERNAIWEAWENTPEADTSYSSESYSAEDDGYAE
ncbi:hypothetical protein H6G89_07135 [Oscillatoria sp. FACHB-1407]|uniref:hypothetical protein n=1 Tax=Oscillatoria sp. FACHB-1407 TaxID=2692847 RepID=UPI00199B30E0|nr:hypothetical protein [Oscillatoria sp. FACHB-1407]